MILLIAYTYRFLQIEQNKIIKLAIQINTNVCRSGIFKYLRLCDIKYTSVLQFSWGTCCTWNSDNVFFQLVNVYNLENISSEILASSMGIFFSGGRCSNTG